MARISVCFFVILMTLYIQQSMQSVAVGFFHNPDHPGKCYLSANNILSAGESAKNPDGCSEIHCGGDNGVAEIHGCSSYGPPPKCTLGDLIDETAPFPRCCRRKIVCDDPKIQGQAIELQNNIYSV